MVTKCCICAAEANPFYPRSFHKIPANEEMRQKWFTIIGRNVSYKGAKVCSSHFRVSDYHEMNQYKKNMILKRTAVPFILAEEESENMEKTNTILNIDTDMHTINNITDIHINSIQNNSNVEIKNRKRKLPQNNKIYSKSKIFLSTSKYSTECFRKSDFVSNQKWEKFLRYISYNRHGAKIMRQKKKRLQNKALTYKDSLQKSKKLLKSKKLTNNDIDAIRVSCIHYVHTSTVGSHLISSPILFHK